MDLSQHQSLEVFASYKNCLKILVVDDEQTNCMILERMLKQDGHEVVLAENGQSAVEMFESESPDLILLDVMMPVMDGYEAATEIKKRCGEKFVPIIFVTALSDEHALAKCLQAGGDDFLTKPYNRMLLRAKMQANLRSADFYQTIKNQKDELLYHRDRMMLEQEVAGEIFEKILRRATFDEEQFRFLFSPTSVMNGDILLITDTPNGHSFVLFGDFTGHGLPAAIGSIPVADIFYTMAVKGHGALKILEEINIKLRLILPSNVFLAAAMLDIDHINQTLAVWNGGIPNVRVYNSQKAQVRTKFVSKHLALGIVDSIDHYVENIQLLEGDKVYMYSDGLTEAFNDKQEMYGEDRLDLLFEEKKNSGVLFDEIIRNVQEFCNGVKQNDDLSLVEYRFTPQKVQIEETQAVQIQQNMQAHWGFDFTFDIETLKNLDPLPLVLHNILEIEELEQHKEKLYMILAELYINAIDHGLLGLDSAMKSSAEGFSAYYDLKERRLKEGHSGKVSIHIQYHSSEEEGKLVTLIEDSGAGFDHKNIIEKLDNNVSFSGRGIALVRSLCQSLEYYGKGNKVKAVYSWS